MLYHNYECIDVPASQRQTSTSSDHWHLDGCFMSGNKVYHKLTYSTEGKKVPNSQPLYRSPRGKGHSHLLNYKMNFLEVMLVL